MAASLVATLMCIASVGDEVPTGSAKYFADLDHFVETQHLDSSTRAPVEAVKPPRFKFFTTVNGRRVEAFKSAEERMRVSEQLERDRRRYRRLQDSIDVIEQRVRARKVQRAIDATSEGKPMPLRTEFWSPRRP